MFTSEEEITLEQYFPYHNMDVEERDYYLNLLKTISRNRRF